MSRIGKKPVAILPNTEVAVAPGLVTVTGPKGTLHLAHKPVISIKVEDGFVIFEKNGNTPEARALWGTYASEVNSMIIGVTTPFEKKLIVEGVGFKSEVQGDKLILNVGFSHTVEMLIPDGISCTAEKNVITVSGISKEKVGKFASEIRSKKKPEPYKGKGIRYHDEVIRRKEGKKAM
jgi:large subunit ribosomal protein L6